MLFGLICMEGSRKTNQAFKNVTCWIKIPEYIPVPVALLLLATQADVMEQDHTRETSVEDSELSYLCFCKKCTLFFQQRQLAGQECLLLAWPDHGDGIGRSCAGMC